MTSPAIGNMRDALKAAFADGVVFSPTIPTTVTAPGVYVAPADPWQEPNTHGLVLEHWDVLCAVSAKEPLTGLDQLRELNLKVVEALHAEGATWRRSSGLRRIANPDNSQIVVSLNSIDFKYPHPE